MLKSRLGFGMMRLPVIGGDPTCFDYEKLFFGATCHKSANFDKKPALSLEARNSAYRFIIGQYRRRISASPKRFQ